MKLIICYLFFVAQAYALNQQDIDSLVKKLDRIQRENNTPAYSLVITNQSETLYSEIRGVDGLQDKGPINQELWFRVGSITKTFVALASLIAEQKNLLDLNQPIIDIVGPEYFQNPWNKTNPLTVGQLLEQTSGLPDMSKVEWDHNVPIALEDALRKFSYLHALKWTPGYFYSYSNTNYGLAGLVLEKTTQQPFDHFVSEQVFKPLEINKASLHFDPNLSKKLIAGYDRDGKTPIPYWHTVYRPLGELSIAPLDMAKLLRMFLNDGTPILSAKTLARMETPQTSVAAQAGLDYGYGPGLYDWFVSGNRFYGHGGDGDGYLAHFGYLKSSQLGYFLAVNAFQPSALKQMRRVIENALIQNASLAVKTPVITLKQPERYIGVYKPVTWRFGSRPANQQLTISINDGQLMAQFSTSGSTEKAYPLIAVAEGLFRWSTESAATMAIIQSPQGWVFSGDEGNFIRVD